MKNLKTHICEWIFIHLIPDWFLFGANNKHLNAIWFWFSENSGDDFFDGHGTDIAS